jgi:hypothetical protein
MRGFLEALPAGTEVSVVTTAPQPRFLVRATTDRPALLKGLDRLSPDGGAGRFVDALNEATQRIEQDPGDYFPVIVMAGTTAGDVVDVRDSDVRRLMERVWQRPTTVHVVLLSGGASFTGGFNQTEVGLAVTKNSGGRYENINSPPMLAKLLPEIGAQVAKSLAGQSRQFKITAERAPGASGDVGRVSLRARSGLAALSVSFDGRLR